MIDSLISNINDAGTKAAIFALIGVIITAIVSALVSLFVSQNSSYISSVTVERSKWIDNLRNNIAELIGVYGSIYAGRGKRDEKADHLIALIKMQLNPNGQIDANIIELLSLFPLMAEKRSKRYKIMEDAFIRHTQFLFKKEWEQVKYEAMGFLRKPFCLWRAQAHKKAYETFCKEQDVLAGAFKNNI